MKWTNNDRCAALVGVLSLVSLACGFSDPWGDNLRPKLHTDYLTQYSGKA